MGRTTLLSPVSRAWVLTAASLLCVVCIVVLSNLPQPRVIEAAQSPADLEASFILWGTGGGARLGFALGFDYLFMAAYVTAIGLGCGNGPCVGNKSGSIELGTAHMAQTCQTEGAIW